MNPGARYHMPVQIKSHILGYRNLIFYVLTIAVFGSLLWFVFKQGSSLEAEPTQPASMGENNQRINAPDREMAGISLGSAIGDLLTRLSQNVGQPLSLLLLQIAMIIV